MSSPHNNSVNVIPSTTELFSNPHCTSENGISPKRRRLTDTEAESYGNDSRNSTGPAQTHDNLTNGTDAYAMTLEISEAIAQGMAQMSGDSVNFANLSSQQSTDYQFSTNHQNNLTAENSTAGLQKMMSMAPVKTLMQHTNELSIGKQVHLIGHWTHHIGQQMLSTNPISGPPEEGSRCRQVSSVVAAQQMDYAYCPICGDKVCGYHYGLLTCESCKTKAAERDAHIAGLRNVLRWECAWNVSEYMYYEVHVVFALLAVMLRDLSMVLYVQETQILDPSNTYYRKTSNLSALLCLIHKQSLFLIITKEALHAILSAH